ncbi:MAG: phage holin family protein [Acidimicrobiia bacterium]|nr:phage holin family protein [Acidimicrobiia bacterium]
MSAPDPRPAPSSALRQLRFGRIVAVCIVSALNLFVMARILPDFDLQGWRATALAVVTIAVLNAVLWPVLARFAAPLILWTVGLLGLVANGAILLLAAEIVPGFDVDGLGTAILASIGMTAVGAAMGSLLAIDDDEVWRRRMIRRMVQRLEPADPNHEPGILFLQIDGLSEAVLRRAIGEGYMPTLARWVRSGSHRIIGWECDLSSQTGASQAGILHGDNTDMPAFRWYDKEAKRVFTSNRPSDAAEIERRHSTGDGLLAAGGVSRSNVFSGDSHDSMFTFSTIADRSRPKGRGFTYFVADPYAIARLIVLSVADIAREIAAAQRARRRDIQPRMKRGGVYPLLRAATTVLLRDLTVYTLLGDIYRGVPAAYVDFVGYDEVAHHSGIAAPDALETLYRLDQQLARLERAIAEAPRPYHVVVLSDHGQTQGATFLQRYGFGLPDLVASLVDRSQIVDAPRMTDEGWGNLNGVLSDAISEEDSRLARLLRTTLTSRTVDGEVVLGPSRDDAGRTGSREAEELVILASGNLGLISFPEIAGRGTLEQISNRYPGLIRGLIEHPGIGFLLIRSEAYGGLVIGRQGIHYLEDGRVEGTDPLEPFGPRAASHVARTDSFSNAPDILVNSFYDPESDEGAAFEELIGFHGGLGGKQMYPFVLFPRLFPSPEEPIVGAASVHQLFSGWLSAAPTGALGLPFDTAPDPVDVIPLPVVEPS